MSRACRTEDIFHIATAQPWDSLSVESLLIPPATILFYPLLLAYSDYYLVGPDNTLFTYRGDSDSTLRGSRRVARGTQLYTYSRSRTIRDRTKKDSIFYSAITYNPNRER